MRKLIQQTDHPYSQEDLSPVSSVKYPAPRIDAHHHLWQYVSEDFPWIADEMTSLRKDFGLEELRTELQAARVDGTVAVQARESLAETEWLLACARSARWIAGVVGWAPLSDDRLSKLLDAFAHAKNLVGFREIVQGKHDGFLEQDAFNRGIRLLTERDLAYDILVYEHQIAETIRFVDRHPKQRFVVDHAAKPKIRANELEPWRTQLYELAQRDNVFCKISGLVTEARWQNWTLESLRPYLDVCADAFGTKRLLAGSDWPVCLVACSYAHWWSVLEIYFADFSADEIDRIFGQNAVEFYRLEKIAAMWSEGGEAPRLQSDTSIISL